jgi:hypothetical protein
VTLALVFLCNALGVVDQTRAANELAAHGAPAALVPTLIMAGRALQLVAGIALVIGWHERRPSMLSSVTAPSRPPAAAAPATAEGDTAVAVVVEEREIIAERQAPGHSSRTQT